jgi:hypothetical protein
VVSLIIFPLHALLPVILELFNDAKRTPEVIVAFEEGIKISDAKSVRCYFELLLGWGRYENPREK